MADYEFPTINKSIERFFTEEEGRVTRNKAIAIGSLMIVMGILFFQANQSLPSIPLINHIVLIALTVLIAAAVIRAHMNLMYPMNLMCLMNPMFPEIIHLFIPLLFIHHHQSQQQKRLLQFRQLLRQRPVQPLLHQQRNQQHLLLLQSRHFLQHIPQQYIHPPFILLLR